MYPFSEAAVQYTVTNLLDFAGIEMEEGFEMALHPESSSAKLMVREDKQVTLKLMLQNELDQLMRGELRLHTIPSFDSKAEIPVFFTGNENDFATITDDGLIVHADILTISFIMLSRFEETFTEERDHRNRFQFISSLACKYDFIEIPIVDEYAMLLKMWLLKYIRGLEISARKAKITPTHDIDFIRRFGNLFRNIKTIIGGDIITRRSLSISLKSLKQCTHTGRDPRKDPFILAIEKLIEVSTENRLRAHFNFKGLMKGQNDCTYDVFAPEVKYCMEMIKEAGMIVGLHASLDANHNEEIFKREKENIESVLGEVIRRNRQHFLLFDINHSLQLWQNCQIKHDYTLGYPEREGFRCGTCHGYFLFDLKNDHISSVKEHPLIAMDTCLFEYRGLNNEHALANLEKLYRRCQAVGGDFVMLWHNDKLFRDYETRFADVYCKFLKENS